MAITEQMLRAKQRFVDNQPNPTELTLDQLRANDDAMFASFAAADVRSEPVDAGGVPALWVSVPETHNDSVVVYFHGGGYFIGSKEGRTGIGGELARVAGGRALVVGYRLAPEHAFPAGVEDAVTAYSWLLEQVDASKIVFSGDSAGAGLAIALTLAAKDRGLPQPAGVVPLSPLVDLTLPGASWEFNADKDPMVFREMVSRAIGDYLQGASPTDPLASPTFGDLAGLAPHLIYVGGDEALLSDARTFTDKLVAAGVDAELRVYADMFHIWPLFAHMLPEGQQAVDEIGEFVRKVTGN